jgi:hypothetical protein
MQSNVLCVPDVYLYYIGVFVVNNTFTLVVIENGSLYPFNEVISSILKVVQAKKRTMTQVTVQRHSYLTRWTCFDILSRTYTPYSLQSTNDFHQILSR